MTLFNRGKSNPHLFPELDKRVGDRNEDDYGSLGEGEWDACIDTSGYIPGHVTAACKALGDRVKHYTFVSTISVYDQTDEPKVVDEDSPVGRLPDGALEGYKRIQDVDGGAYGPLKALCEEAAEAAYPGKVANVRPGLIVGPGDGSDRFTYWPVRLARGGEVLCPGDGTRRSRSWTCATSASFVSVAPPSRSPA